MRFTKKLMERGTFTIPSDIREALGIEDGDFVELEIVGILKRSTPVTLNDLRHLPVQTPAERVKELGGTTVWSQARDADSPRP